MNIERITLTPDYLTSQGFNNTFQERFWKKVRKTESCWVWIGSRAGGTYGDIHKGHGKNIKAHIASWIMHFGPVPEGLKVLHRCDNYPCVRPDHLFLGTQVDNMRDCINKGRFSTATMFRGKISKDVANEIRRLYFDCNVTQAALGRAFHLHQTTIWSIVHFKTWF
jgi:hypothetical protein